MSTETSSNPADSAKSRISGKEATYVALAAAKYRRSKLVHRTIQIKAQRQLKRHPIFRHP
jgi:hypothetical protein